MEQRAHEAFGQTSFREHFAHDWLLAFARNSAPPFLNQGTQIARRFFVPLRPELTVASAVLKFGQRKPTNGTRGDPAHSGGCRSDG